MRKMNPTMVTISGIVTALFVILFFVSLGRAASIQTSYGSPAMSPPYIVGMLLAHSLIPGILWIIAYYTGEKVNNNISSTNKPTSNGGYSGGYGGGHNNPNSSTSSNSPTGEYGGGYSGGHNNSNDIRKEDGYTSGDLYK